MEYQKKITHFQKKNDGLPLIDSFLSLYRNNLDDDFVLGYYIHLYTDYIWFKDFIPSYTYNKLIHKLDGSLENFSQVKLKRYVYSDYTNLNTKLIDEYKINLNILGSDISNLDNIIKEILMSKLYIIMKKASDVTSNISENELHLFDIGKINRFISYSSKVILDNLKELGVIYN